MAYSEGPGSKKKEKKKSQITVNIFPQMRRQVLIFVTETF